MKHPGATLRALLKVRGWSGRELAHIIGRPVPPISEILNGKKRITAATALELEAALGCPSADGWLAMQAAYDLDRAYPEHYAKLDGIEARMRERGWSTEG